MELRRESKSKAAEHKAQEAEMELRRTIAANEIKVETLKLRTTTMSQLIEKGQMNAAEMKEFFDIMYPLDI